MTGLVLSFLGPPRIELDRKAVRLSRRKAIALLAFLAVTQERHRRDTLINLLWPEYDTPRGRAALRRTLYSLRKALGSDFLDIDRSAAGMQRRNDLWVDVEQFRLRLAECENHDHPSTKVCADCVAPLSEAVALYRGDFLSGFGLKDSFNFDDWQRMQAENLRRELAGALARLAEWHSSQREYDVALGFARRKVALDPLDEEAHRDLMRLYAWSGQRPAALRQFDECAAVLDEEMGVPPQEATTALYTAIREGSTTPPAEAEAEPASPPSFLEGDRPAEATIFVAREAELSQLDRHLDKALAGHGRVVFVTGDAGSGKTALVQEFARRAQEARPGLVSAAGHGNAQTGIGDPYLPFREILCLLTGDIEAQWAAGAMTREQARRLWQMLPVAAQALAEDGPDLIDTFVPRSTLLKRAVAYGANRKDGLRRLTKPGERKLDAVPAVAGILQSDLFEQYSRVLQALAKRSPLLLVLDDLQWADLGSISLLFHLGRQLAGHRILILGTYRPEEIALGRPDPTRGAGQSERHPLEPVVSEFQRDFGDITVNLGTTAGREFVDALLDSEPNRLDNAFREMLYRQTRGHPLFTAELLRGLQEQGNLLQDPEGRWVVGPALDWEALPARVEAVVAERVNRLPENLRAALQVASVEGETFTAEVVAQVQAANERDLVMRLSRDLDKRHRLVRAQGIQRMDGRRVSQYRFRHIVFQRYLYGSLDEIERAYLHESVGDTLEALYKSQPETMLAIAGQLAWHFQEAGMVEKAIHYLHQAGERAVQLSAYQEARAHLTMAVELLLTLPDSAERAKKELALQLSLGMAWIGTDPTEVEKASNRARELAMQTGQTSDLYRILGTLSVMHYVGAKHHSASELAEETIILAEQLGDPLLMALGHWRLGFILFALGDFAAARTHLEHMIAFYEPQHHGPLIFLSGADGGLSAMAYHALCLWALGYPDQASKQSEEALTQAKACDHPFTAVDVLAYGGCVYDKMLRNGAAMLEHADKMVELATERGFANWLGMGLVRRGEALALLGEVEDGREQLGEGIAAQQAVGAQCYLPTALCTLAEAQARAGHPGQGLATLDEAQVLMEETDERHWEVELHRLRAELLLMLGMDTSAAAKAEASLHKAIEVARRQRAKSWELRAATSLARLWHDQGRGQEARVMLAETYDWFTEGFDTPDLLEARTLLNALSSR
jgi:predicted ATPase/DNA-binding SARP family transcriptional activator